MVRYVKCPRCELNYIDADKQEYCDICLAELKGGRFDCVELADEEEEDMELCPICGENMMRVGEKMCDECKKKTAYEEESEVDPEKDEGWRDFIDDETEEVDLPDVPDVTMDDFDSDEEEEDDLYHGEEEEEDFEYVTADEADDLARDGEDDEDDEDDDF